MPLSIRHVISKTPLGRTVRFATWITFTTLLIAPHGSAADQPREEERPNIVFVLLDDLDYYDVGAYGSPDIRTPNLDRLAEQGLRFDRYYSAAPVCSPARVALLTGIQPATLGVLRAVSLTSLRGIPKSVTTLPEVLKRAGYRTVHLGKWHVGARRYTHVPTKKGFDRSYRFEGHHYINQRLVVDDHKVMKLPKGSHLTTVLTDLAINELRKAAVRETGKPLFINLWHFAPHAPWELPSDYDNGATQYCLDREARSCDDARGRFAALVTHADAEIGRLANAIDSMGLGRRTVLIVASDNGGTRPSHEPATLPERPLSGYKASLSEGAIRVPMIARWLGHIEPGTVTEATVSGIDILPTLAEVVGAVPPSDIDGKSFAALLNGAPFEEERRSLIWENKPGNTPPHDLSGIPNTFAVRSGPWKLIYRPDGPRESERRSLFNVEEDPAELHDLLASAPVASTEEFHVLGYRVPAMALHTDEQKPGELKYGVLASELEQTYWRWRLERGAIPYHVREARASKRKTDFKPTVLEYDERLDFHDGDFTYMTTVRPETSGASGTISERPGSWRLYLDRGHLRLRIKGSKDHPFRRAPTARLDGPVLDAMRTHHVAFTAYASRDAPSTLRLYLNGEVVAQSADGNSVRSVAPGNTATPHTLFVGVDGRGRGPFPGSVALPRTYTRSLFAPEIVAVYARDVAAVGSDAYRPTSAGSAPGS